MHDLDQSCGVINWLKFPDFTEKERKPFKVHAIEDWSNVERNDLFKNIVTIIGRSGVGKTSFAFKYLSAKKDPDKLLTTDLFQDEASCLIEATSDRPAVSQLIEKLRKDNEELSDQLKSAVSEVSYLKSMFKSTFKPKLLKILSINGLIIASFSLFISLIYGFDFMHPYFIAAPLTLMSAIFFTISYGIEKTNKIKDDA